MCDKSLTYHLLAPRIRLHFIYTGWYEWYTSLWESWWSHWRSWEISVFCCSPLKKFQVRAWLWVLVWYASHACNATSHSPLQVFSVLVEAFVYVLVLYGVSGHCNFTFHIHTDSDSIGWGRMWEKRQWKTEKWAEIERGCGVNCQYFYPVYRLSIGFWRAVQLY